MSKIGVGITRATISTEGVISAEGKIGKNKASGSIDSEGIWDLGIDFKVGGLGITNDYGGAITISIAGQSITWGREGGKIHYNLGGFEVIVEARDCVVTETKLIMGMEVASHTYPDPGCELPDPLPPPPNPLPIILDPDKGVEIPASDQFFWVPIDWVRCNYNTQGVVVSTEEVTVSKADKEQGVVDGRKLPFKMTTNYKHPAYPEFTTITEKNTIVPKSTLFTNVRPDYRFKDSSGISVICFLSRRNGVLTGFIDTGVNIRNYLNRHNANNDEYLNAPNIFIHGNAYIFRYKPLDFIPVGEQIKIQPPLQPGVPPQMKDNCCEEILESLDDLKEVLHVDFFKKEKFPVPSYLLAPGVDTSKTTVANNYYNLFQKLFQALAHSTIISPKVDIQDADAVKEGDQPVNSEYLSATGWAEAVTKMLYEIVDDGNVGTNMDIRTGVTVTQLLVAVADLSHKVDCIIDCIGVTTKRTKGEVETSYSLVVEEAGTKGFDPKKANQKLDLNSDISTEQLLSSLLRTRKNPIVKEEIHPKSPTLFELLQDLKQKE